MISHHNLGFLPCAPNSRIQQNHNVAIIAHVDRLNHARRPTSPPGWSFRENQEVAERVMDNNDLERERGITILSEGTSISYKGNPINIIGRPGHANFVNLTQSPLQSIFKM
ncbi:MAG: hypothetical protein IPN71_16350 [Fibrobacteres bacterium]|nr:hypothetical protein [Fibrobacterota bacterium]